MWFTVASGRLAPGSREAEEHTTDLFLLLIKLLKRAKCCWLFFCHDCKVIITCLAGYPKSDIFWRGTKCSVLVSSQPLITFDYICWGMMPGLWSGRSPALWGSSLMNTIAGVCVCACLLQEKKTVLFAHSSRISMCVSVRVVLGDR